MRLFSVERIEVEDSEAYHRQVHPVAGVAVRVMGPLPHRETEEAIGAAGRDTSSI